MKKQNAGSLPGASQEIEGAKWMGHNTANNPQNQLPARVLILAADIEILLAQRRLGIPPTPGSVARILRLGHAIVCSFTLLYALREARRNILPLTAWDRDFLSSMAVRP